MRALVQRVLRGSVEADGETVGAIGPGIVVLLGVFRDDTSADSDHLIRKLLTVKLFKDGEKPWCKSVKEAGLELLVVSQFTLCHRFKGTKPDFHEAMNGELSKPLFDEFVNKLKKEYASDKVQTGKFGSYMNIDLRLDGPVTLVLDSPPKTEPKKPEQQNAPAKPETS